MANRKRNIVFETWEEGEARDIYVWTDLTPDQLEKVEGVGAAGWASKGMAYKRITIDSRYDLAEVQAEIATLAEANAEPVAAEQKTSRWRVTVIKSGRDSWFTVLATSCSDAALKAEKKISDYRMAGEMPPGYKIIRLERLT